MLNLKICEKCWNAHSYCSLPIYGEGLELEFVFVLCPTLTKLKKPQFVKDSPDEKCPYRLEHIISGGKYVKS